MTDNQAVIEVQMNDTYIYIYLYIYIYIYIDIYDI